MNLFNICLFYIITRKKASSSNLSFHCLQHHNEKIIASYFDNLTVKNQKVNTTTTTSVFVTTTTTSVFVMLINDVSAKG